MKMNNELPFVSPAMVMKQEDASQIYPTEHNRVRNRLVKWPTSLFLMSMLVISMSQASFADTTNLKIYGTVVASSCDLDTDSTVIPVKLADTGSGYFKSVGTVGTPTYFNINLKECSDAIAGGSLAFRGTADSNNKDLVKLSGDSSAAGVGIEIIDGVTHDPIALASDNAVALKPGDNTLNYGVQYKSTLAEVTPGTANAVMYFDITYQ